MKRGFTPLFIFIKINKNNNSQIPEDGRTSLLSSKPSRYQW